jgi:hypothetical protein
MRSDRAFPLALLLLLLLLCGQSFARSGMIIERPWASEHIDSLPSELRKRLYTLERLCGNAAAAAHYFAPSIEANGARFVSLHFEEYACDNRAVICDSSGCLHEVYLKTRGGYRMVFSGKAIDLKMTNADGVAGLKVISKNSTATYRWNGRGFSLRTTQPSGQ